ncbi:hypothetical protein BZM27_54345, partial [Paraburkholderia steynii]
MFVPSNGTQAALNALAPLPRQIISITETAWEVIERYARYCGLLVFDSERGRTHDLAGRNGTRCIGRRTRQQRRGDRLHEEHARDLQHIQRRAQC